MNAYMGYYSGGGRVEVSGELRINSGLWIVKLGDKIEKGSTTAQGQ